jgi:flagellar basal-body rod protein FlgG
LASGLWTAASGAGAQAQNLDLIANNLANVDTAAFKKDLPTFKEYLATVENPKITADIPRGQVQDKDLYHIDGKDQAFVVMDGSYTNHRQGGLRVTQAPLDLALDGPGFLEVSTPNGLRYTRDGSLKIATDGRLVTRDGFPILSNSAAGPDLQTTGASGPNVAARFINLKDQNTHLTINQSGEIFSGETLVAKLSVVEFKDLNSVKKSGGHFFEAVQKNQSVSSENTIIRQGMLESSNVNPIEEMTNMIKANRLFEHDLKAMKTFGDLMSKEVNEVGKL